MQKVYEIFIPNSDFIFHVQTTLLRQPRSPCVTGLSTVQRQMCKRKVVNKFMTFAYASLHLAISTALRLLTVELFEGGTYIYIYIYRTTAKEYLG